MGHGLVIATLERAAGHAALLGVVILVVAVGLLVRHASRTRSDRASDRRGGHPGQHGDT
jgi:hypothetical protein